MASRKEKDPRDKRKQALSSSGQAVVFERTKVEVDVVDARVPLEKSMLVSRPPGAVDVFIDEALENPETKKVLEAWAK